MITPAYLYSLSDVAAAYDVVLCDIWGVIHDGVRVDAGAVAALARFRAAGGTVILISNVPKPNAPIYDQLTRLGAPREAYDAIVTSGDAIRVELAARSPGPMHKIGPPDFDAVLWEGLGLVESDIDNAAFLGVSGLDRPDREHPDDYAPRLERARARDLDMLCANPDVVVRVGKTLVWCAGAIAERYAALGGRVVMAGKPCPPIYAMARAQAARVRGAPTPDRRILTIGDGPHTDIKGANAEGLDCLFIATGVNEGALIPAGSHDLENVTALLASHGLTAQFAARTLA